MKILVCSDGSTQSRKAMEKAAKIVGESRNSEVAVIHVFEKKTTYRGVNIGYQHMTQEEHDSIVKASKIAGEKILAEAAQFFSEKNIPVTNILKGGHPAQIIARVANEEGYDMIIIGSKGMGGLNRLFLGSVSNAVLLEAKTDVLVVK